ncbi:MAG: tetratricopeptide repeat protein, partial [Myxococcales bacterium]|nr:tetratricopeptide repeat protein [Myxococcales bacterium]
LATIAARGGKAGRAQQLADQVLGLPEARLSAPDRSQALVVKARLALGAEGGAEQAVRDLEEAIKAWPENLAAIELLSERHMGAGEFEKALDQLENLQAAGVKSAELSIRIAAAARALGRNERAEKTLEEAAQAFPDKPAVQAAIGDLALDQKDYDTAREAYEKALSLDAGYQQARLRIADLLVRKAKVREAIEYIEEGIRKNPNSAALLVGLGQMQIRLGVAGRQRQYFEEAKATFEKALKVDPTSQLARLALARALVRLDQPKPALKLLEELAVHPDVHEDLSYDLAGARAELGDHAGAIEDYERALVLRKDDPEVLVGLAEAFINKGDPERAREPLERALKSAPDLAKAHYLAGRVELAAGKAGDAVQRFKRALDFDTRDYATRYWLGRALETQGDPAAVKAAREEYDLVASAAEKDDRLAQALCDVFYRRGRLHMYRVQEWGDAKADFERCLKCDNSRADVWLALGRVTEDAGKRPEAIKLYREAIKRNGGYGEAYAAAGNAYMSLSPPDRQNALAMLKQAVRHEEALPLPHYQLCALYKDNAPFQAKEECRRYLKLAGPDGDFVTNAQELLKGL